MTLPGQKRYSHPDFTQFRKAETAQQAGGHAETHMSVRVFPRRKAGEECSSPEKGRLPLKFDIDTIQPLFALPQKDAANVLGISLTALKKVCRKLGIHSWAQVRDVRIPPQASIYAQNSAHMGSAPAVLEHGANFGTIIAPMRRRGAPRSPRGRDTNRKTTCTPTFWPEANKNAVPMRSTLKKWARPFPKIPIMMMAAMLMQIGLSRGQSATQLPAHAHTLRQNTEAR